MTPQEKKQIEDFNREIYGNSIRITARLNHYSQALEIQEFCETLSQSAPSVIIKNEKTDDETELPAIVVGESLYYHAVPLGPELAPFLTALKISANREENQAVADIRQRLAQWNSAAAFDIFIAPQCPFCPNTVKTLMPLAFAGKLIRVSIIDAALFPEAATSRGIRSVPAVFLDQSFSWTGTVDIDEIIRVVENRDPVQLSADSLKKMIHEGFAWKVAELMVAKGLIFPNFMELLADGKWTVRLGAMAAAEEMIFRDANLAAQLEKLLWEKFPCLEDPVKADMLYLLGETGTRDTISNIKTFLDGNVGSDILEAGQEAIDTLLEKFP